MSTNEASHEAKTHHMTDQKWSNLVPTLVVCECGHVQICIHVYKYTHYLWHSNDDTCDSEMLDQWQLSHPLHVKLTFAWKLPLASKCALQRGNGIEKLKKKNLNLVCKVFLVCFPINVTKKSLENGLNFGTDQFDFSEVFIRLLQDLKCLFGIRSKFNLHMNNSLHRVT